MVGEHTFAQLTTAAAGSIARGSTLRRRVDKRTTQSRGGSRCVDSCSCSALPCSPCARGGRSRRGMDLAGRRPGAARVLVRSGPSIRGGRASRDRYRRRLRVGGAGARRGRGHVRRNGSGQRQVADDPHLRRVVGHADAARIDRGGEGRVGRRGRRASRRSARAATPRLSGPYVQLGIRHADQDQGYVDPQTLLPPRAQAPAGPATTGGTVQPPSAVSVPTSTDAGRRPLRHDRSGRRWNCTRRGSAAAGGQRGGGGRCPDDGRRPAAAAPARGDRSTAVGSQRRRSATGADVAPAVETARRLLPAAVATPAAEPARAVLPARSTAPVSTVAARPARCAEPIGASRRRPLGAGRWRCRRTSSLPTRVRHRPATAVRAPTSAGREPRRSLPSTERSLRSPPSRSARPERHSRRLARATQRWLPAGAGRQPRRLDLAPASRAVGAPPLACRCGARARARVAARSAPPTGGSATRSYDCPR